MSIAWYRTGKATAIRNSTAVHGLQTEWASHVQPGDMFTFDGDHFYEVAEVIHDTELTLRTDYLEATIAAGAYAIIPSSASSADLAALVAQAANSATAAAASTSVAQQAQEMTEAAQAAAETAEAGAKASMNAAVAATTTAAESAAAAAASASIATTSATAADAARVATEASRAMAASSASAASSSAGTASQKAAEAISSALTAATSASLAQQAEAAAMAAQDAAVAARMAAETAQTAAETAKTGADTAKAEAEAAMNAAAASASNAATSESNAQKWAENPVDVAITPDHYSALHYATKAADAKTAAEAAAAKMPSLTGNGGKFPRAAADGSAWTYRTPAEVLADIGAALVSHTHPAATTEAMGLVELATNVEVQAGTDTTRAVTPAGLMSAFGSYLASNGYQKLPSGLILQWGGAFSSGAAADNGVITFPIAFPTACLAAVATITGHLTGSWTIQRGNVWTTGCAFTTSLNGSYSSGSGFNYIAFGY